ncbi:MAG: ComF family protein [Prolixibacteraceae bacterium]
MKLFSQFVDLSEDLLGLIYPKLCVSCENVLMKQEHLICSNCVIGLPRTHYHFVKDNPIEMIFWGRVKIEKATSYFQFQKGSKYQKLMHELKYKGMREIGVELGRKFGAELMQTNYFGEVDYLIPVPLHPKKERKRGYNQSLAIAEGMAQILGKEIRNDILFRQRYSETQTRKGRFERWQNVNELFWS